MSEENKALARHSWEASNNPDIIDEVYTPDLVWHDPDQEIRGSEEAKQFLSHCLSLSGTVAGQGGGLLRCAPGPSRARAEA